MEKKYFNGIREDIVFLIPKDAKIILEIGCGNGEFAKHFPTNCEYWGVEPNILASEIAQKNLNTVLNGKLEDIFYLIPDRYFDLIVCNDVIEHMENHEWFFNKIKQKLKNNKSILIGSVPNVRHIINLYNLIIRKEWTYTESGILDRTHLRFFTEKSLKQTIILNNFEIIELKKINKFKLNKKSMYYYLKGLITLMFCFILGEDTKYSHIAIKISSKKEKID